MINSDFVQLLRHLQLLTKRQRAQVRSVLDETEHQPISAIASVLPRPDGCLYCHALAE